MLKKRIIPTLLLKNGRLIKGKDFKNYKDVGDPLSVVKIYSNQYADELIFINIGEKEKDFEFLINTLSEASKNCFIPLTAGGGINSLDKAKKLFKSGADKILVTSEIVKNSNLILDISKKFGRQAMVAGIDILEDKDEIKIVYGRNREISKYKIEEFIKILENKGAGEILINFVKRDGMMNGTNLKILKKICNMTRSPIITLGGMGNFLHLEEVFTKTNCDAIACSSIFHFADNNPIRARSYLKNKFIKQRIIK